VNEAQECLGGNGYVEESIVARLYRQAPLNSIWEGSGNIQCLDVLRALAREPDTAAALLAELEGVRGMHASMDATIDTLRKAIAGDHTGEAGARLLVERLALALQAATLLRAGNPTAIAFCRSRLGGGHGLGLGTLPADERFDVLVERALPAT
jgi:putative acyl-CoA dehydrogenase